MTTPRLSAQDLRVAAEVHRELGPEYSDAVVDSFLEKVDAKIDARLAELATPRRQPPARVISGSSHGLVTGMTLGGGIAGIALSVLGFLTAENLPAPNGSDAVWMVILVVSCLSFVVGMVRKGHNRD